MAYVNFKTGTLEEITTANKPENLLSFSTDIPSIFKGNKNITCRVIDASLYNNVLGIRKINADGIYDSEYINMNFAHPYTAGEGITIDSTNNIISLNPEFTIFEIVSALPTENIQKSKIYLVPSDSSTAQNAYVEYHYLGSGVWEILGERKSDILNSLVVSSITDYTSDAVVYDISIGDSYNTAFSKLQSKLKKDYIQTETDPVYSASAAAGITSADISTWNSYANVKADWNASTGDAEILNKPDISSIHLLYYDDTTGVLATSGYSITFQEDLSDFDVIKCYFRASLHNASDSNAIPAGSLYINLGAESVLTSGEFTGSTTIPYLNNTNRYAAYVCMINANKTQFKVVSQQSLYGTAATNISNDSHGIYCYKIEGFKKGGMSSDSGDSGEPVVFVETDPTVPNYVKAITQQDISTWNLQSDWNESDSTSKSYILNKPVLPQGLPAVTSADNGKVLQVIDGSWGLITPLTLYSGTGTPNNSQGNNGDLYAQI